MKPLHCKYYFRSCGSIKNDALEESDKSSFWGVKVRRIMTLICYTQLSQQTHGNYCDGWQNIFPCGELMRIAKWFLN